MDLRGPWLTVFLLGCGADPSNPARGADGGPLPPSCSVTEAPAGFPYPTGPYGSDVGAVFEDLTLEDCDGTPVSFGSVLAGAELVLFNVGAGWCQPCIEESKTLEAAIFRPFCCRGLRAVQVLFQDEESRPATKLFCRQWKERFGISFPVLVDPLFSTQRLFDRGQTPLNLLIDSSGVIRYRETGTPAMGVPDRIDQLLPR